MVEIKKAARRGRNEEGNETPVFQRAAFMKSNERTAVHTRTRIKLVPERKHAATATWDQHVRSRFTLHGTFHVGAIA